MERSDDGHICFADPNNNLDERRHPVAVKVPLFSFVSASAISNSRGDGHCVDIAPTTEKVSDIGGYCENDDRV